MMSGGCIMKNNIISYDESGEEQRIQTGTQ